MKNSESNIGRVIGKNLTNVIKKMSFQIFRVKIKDGKVEAALINYNFTSILQDHKVILHERYIVLFYATTKKCYNKT